MEEEYYGKVFRGFFFKGLAHFLGVTLILYFIMMAITGGEFHFSFISIATFSYAIIYMMTHKVRRRTLSIDSKEAFKETLKDAMAYMHYDIIEEREDFIIIKPQWHEKAYTARLFIELKEKEAKLIGVSQHVYKILDAYEEQQKRKGS